MTGAESLVKATRQDSCLQWQFPLCTSRCCVLVGRFVLSGIPVVCNTSCQDCQRRQWSLLTVWVVTGCVTLMSCFSQFFLTLLVRHVQHSVSLSFTSALSVTTQNSTVSKGQIFQESPHFQTYPHLLVHPFSYLFPTFSDTFHTFLSPAPRPAGF